MSAPALDWPRDLRLAAAIRPLAVAIYVAQCRADGVAPHFAGLALHQQRIYDDAAVITLRGLRVAKRVDPLFDLALGLARNEAAKIVGRISEREPWGVREDPRD